VSKGGEALGRNWSSFALPSLVNQIKPVYPKVSSKGGRQPYPLGTILRIHLMPKWCCLSEPTMEDALIEIASIRRSAGIAEISNRIPNEKTILAFQH
jgi:IS5 family transposase